MTNSLPTRLDAVREGDSKVSSNVDLSTLSAQSVLWEGEQFLLYEAELLDNGRFQDWLGLLSDDIEYKIPIRTTRARGATTEFSDESWHTKDNRGSLEMRIARIYTDYNWAEEPASRTRHFLTNFRLQSVEEEGDDLEAVLKTNLLVFRSRFDDPSHQLVSGERLDTLRKTNGKWKLAKRMVYLDHTTMAVSNLGIFL